MSNEHGSNEHGSDEHGISGGATSGAEPVRRISGSFAEMRARNRARALLRGVDPDSVPRARPAAPLAEAAKKSPSPRSP